MDLTGYQHKTLAILGYGAEGKSTLKFLLTHGISPDQITILDKAPVQTDHPHIISGENYLDGLFHYDLIFKSAGIPYFPQLQAVADHILTQVQFFFNRYQGNVIAITASKGKTTMTSLAYHLLKNAGYQVKVVGNIGRPVLDEIDFEISYDYVIIELSSYMLQTLKKQNAVSILGAFFPEHLDWHGGKEAYLQAKLNILQGSKQNIIFKSVQSLIPEPFKTLATYCGKGTAYDRNTDFFLLHGKPLFPLRDIQLLGEHNLRNSSAIIALAEHLHIDTNVLHQTIKEFQPVSHRLQYVGMFQGIDFYDDAISTTPESTIAALEALGEKVETIFLGGLDRGYDFSNLVEKIKKSQIKQIVFFPESGATLAKMLGISPLHGENAPSKVIISKGLTILFSSSMQEAVQFAYQYTSVGKICLLSTASPSYSIWKNFEEKGELFQTWIKKLAFSEGFRMVEGV